MLLTQWPNRLHCFVQHLVLFSGVNKWGKISCWASFCHQKKISFKLCGSKIIIIMILWRKTINCFSQSFRCGSSVKRKIIGQWVIGSLLLLWCDYKGRKVIHLYQIWHISQHLIMHSNSVFTYSGAGNILSICKDLKHSASEFWKLTVLKL